MVPGCFSCHRCTHYPGSVQRQRRPVQAWHSVDLFMGPVAALEGWLTKETMYRHEVLRGFRVVLPNLRELAWRRLRRVAFIEPKSGSIFNFL